MTIKELISSVQSSVEKVNLTELTASDHGSLCVDSLQISTETEILHSDGVYYSDVLRDLPVLFSDYLIKQLETHIRTKSGHTLLPELIQKMNNEKRKLRNDLKTFLALHQSEWLTPSFEKQLYNFIAKRLQVLSAPFGLTFKSTLEAVFCMSAFKKIFKKNTWLQPVDISFSEEQSRNTVMMHLEVEAI